MYKASSKSLVKGQSSNCSFLCIRTIDFWIDICDLFNQNETVLSTYLKVSYWFMWKNILNL